ncbi:hypothetical protein QAD02_001661 [Eretmocerus hayati]|uniref:Uncharacterized protein n=1 Tax=Eretmocerus hayati TaxID=131215 RepID=A0ACC2NH28_9HYME|nr:hypothetical protein QAD02_001661 [Eretmocerus hayati]
MTVSYQNRVAASSSGGFTRLLFLWRGSLYKLVWRELIVYLVVFGLISFCYRHLFDYEQRKSFEPLVDYCRVFIDAIPLSFLLGFYVACVANRWWQQYTAIPSPDKIMHSLALYVDGDDEYGRTIRRTLVRYMNLSLILVLRSISSAVQCRFPTYDHIVRNGFITPKELEIFQSVPADEFNTYWIPCTWFINLLKEARSKKRLTDSQGLKIIMEEFNEFRSKCGMLKSYDTISIPLVYTQVVTLATYCYFGVSLIGRQAVNNSSKPFHSEVDKYFPIFTVMQFLFYMGLLKVAEQLINPFGEDDEDFELNGLIDRHTKVSYLGVDTLMNRCPPLVKDMYYDTENIVFSYAEADNPHEYKICRGSTTNIDVPETQTRFLPNLIADEKGQTTNGMLLPITNTNEASSDDSSSPSTKRFNLAILIATSLVVFLYAEEDEKYDSKYDDIDFKTILANDRARLQYERCFLGTAPCITPDAVFMKKQVPEAIVTKCRKCTEKQKEGLEGIAVWYAENDPDTWTDIVRTSILDFTRKNTKKTIKSNSKSN